MVSFKINSEEVSFDGGDDTPLLWVIRDHLQLTGTKFGCGIGQCGACTVHVDGVALRSCTTTVGKIDGRSVTTIEGLANSDDALHPVQQAMVEHHGSQCGFCTPGFVMSLYALYRENEIPSRQEIDDALAGNLCRCGTYTRVRKAVADAAQQMKES